MTSIFPRRQPWRMLFPVLWWAAVTGFAHATHSLWIVGLWIYPMVTGFWAIFRVRVWTEHVGVPYHGKESSHRFTVGPLGPFFFFPHHTYCHYEHHKWPQIPYYSLPAVRSADDSRPILPLKDLFPTR